MTLPSVALQIGTVKTFFAAVPLLLAGVLLVGFLWPATRAMPLAWVCALVIGFVVQGVPLQ